MALEVKLVEDGRAIIAAVRGRIEGTDDAESLRIALDEGVKSAGLGKKKALLVALEELTYTDSAGLRTFAFIINRTREAEMRLILYGANDSVRELLELSGFDQFVEVAETLEEAKRMLSA